MNSAEKRFIVMMLPYCSEIAEGRRVDLPEVITMQNVFLYAVTGDEMFIDSVRSGYPDELLASKQAFLEGLRAAPEGPSMEFISKLPKPMSIAILWWSSLRNRFKDKYPEQFGARNE